MQKIFTFLFSLVLCAVCILPAQALSPEGQRAIRRGSELFDFGRWNDAQHEFRAARAELTSKDRAARQEIDFYLAACAVELGAEDAEAVLLDFGARYPHSVYENDLCFSLGSYYCATGNMTRAKEYFAGTNYKALSAARRQQYDIRMGYVEFALNDYRKAYDYFDRIPAKSEYADHAHYYKAYIDYADNKLQLARQGFSALQGSAAYGAVVPYYLLQIEFREGNYRYVVEHGDELARKATPERRIELARVIAESWFRLDNYAQTLYHLNAFAEAGGVADRETSYLMGFSLYRQARYAEATDWLRKACGAEDALTQNASYHVADCYLRVDDKQAAMEAFAMASDARFDAVVAEDALFNYAKLQYELGGGAFNGAINVLQRYIETYPKSSRLNEARALLVAAYYNSQDYDAAYNALKVLPTRDGELRAALQKITYFRALEAIRGGDLAAAKRYLAESAMENASPKYSALNLFWQGEIAYAQGDPTLAAAKFNAYLQRAPRTESQYVMAWYNLGYCAFQRRDMGQVTTAFDTFLSLRPTADRYRADAYNRLGDAHYAARRFAAAVGEYDKAIKTGGGEQYYAQYQRAVTLGLLGRAEQKQQMLQEIVAAGQGDYVEAALYELGRTLIAQEKYTQGATELERFIKTYPSSPRYVQALSDLGLSYLNMGNRTKSLHYYDMAVTAAPRSSEARAALQGIRDIYVSDGNVDAYFDYAAKAGMESDLTVLSRDSLSFASAQKLYLADQTNPAAKALRSYIKSYPKGTYLNDALYYLSDCYLRLGERLEAIETLATLAAEPTNQYTATILDKLATMTFAERRYEEAAEAYRKRYDVTTVTSEREAAMTGYVRATLAGGDAKKIAVMAEDVVAKSDAGATARREARFAWAEQLRGAENHIAARKLYEQLAAEIHTMEGSAAAYYLIEELFRSGEMTKTEKAIFAYADRNPKAYWLAKAYLVLGDVYVHKGDNFQARATYQSVADGYSPADDGIVEAAKEKIRKLN